MLATGQWKWLKKKCPHVQVDLIQKAHPILLQEMLGLFVCRYWKDQVLWSFPHFLRAAKNQDLFSYFHFLIPECHIYGSNKTSVKCVYIFLHFFFVVNTLSKNSLKISVLVTYTMCNVRGKQRVKERNASLLVALQKFPAIMFSLMLWKQTLLQSAGDYLSTN